MKNCITLLCVAFAFCNVVFAQTDIAAPQIIPPSPDAAALGKYGEFPTDLSNGLIKTEVPLYTVKSRSLELPISLSYHASGNKINDVASWVGLGWVLNATGVIARTIRGRPDEWGGYLNYFMTTRQLDLCTDRDSVYNFLNPRGVGTTDSESDIYTYNVHGLSGTFLYTKDHELLQVPLTDNKILDNVGNSYTIIADNGTSYIFDIAESTYHNDWSYANSAFYLSKMISADKTDTIYFEYFSDGKQYSDISLSDYTNCNDAGGLTMDINANKSTRILQKIRFTGGYVSFIVNGDRKDRRKYRLTDIKVYDDSHALKNWIQLAHGYYTSFIPQSIDTVNYANTAYRLRLDSIKMLDQTGKLTAAWSLRYNNTVLPAYYSAQNPNAHYFFGQDLWGYYNGVITNQGLLHYTTPCNGSRQPANRSVSTAHAQAGILTEIKYPTGGRTFFTYESNTCGSMAGGLRIQKVENYADSTALPVTKTYTYFNCFTTNYYGYLNSPNNYVYSKANVYITGTASWIVNDYYVSSPILPLSYNSNSVFYKNVTEYQGTVEKNSGKTEYIFEAEEDSVYATNVKLPTGSYYQGLILNYPRYNYFAISRSWSRGPLKESNVYRREPNGDYTLIQKTVNTYQFYKPQTAITGINVFKNFTYPVGEKSPATAAEARYRFQYFDILTNTWSKKLRQTIVTNYSGASTFSQLVRLEYDSITAGTRPHLLVTKKTTVNSRGDSITTQYQYPCDLAATGVYNSMWQNNIKNKLVKEIEKINGTDTRGAYTQFAAYAGQGGTMYLPSVTQKYFRNIGWKEESVIDQYDNLGNIRQLHIGNNAPASYLYDYKNLYPVAEVAGAAQNDIAYTSFEADGKGNFTFSGSAISDNTSPTGTKAYTLTGSNNVIKTGLLSSRSYIVSYWQKNSTTALIIAGTQGSAVKGKTINGWSYYEHTVTGVTQITITGSAKTIDELRAYPIEAQMNTYTYTPLAGISSRCDANNRITYYEYDDNNRLKLIRDQDKNIIKTFNYNYITGN